MELNMPVYNDRTRNVKIKVREQDKKTRIIVKDPAPNLDFHRAIMDFEVQHKLENGEWELRTDFDPPIELMVGFENADNVSWDLQYLDPKTNEYIDFSTKHDYKKPNGHLFPNKGKNKHVVVILKTWGDPNVGWGG